MLVVIYQPLYHWFFKDPVSIIGAVKHDASNISGKSTVNEINFTINNRQNRAFRIEKIIIKIDDHHHVLDQNKSITYPTVVNGLEAFTLKLPLEFLGQLTKREMNEFRKMLGNVSITIRGNNASYVSDTIFLN